MRVAYHHPYPDTIYAHRTIFNGFKAAFEDLGHVFLPVTPEHDLVRRLDEDGADLFVTSSHFLYRKYVDYGRLMALRKRGLFVLTKVDFWSSPLERSRIHEAKSLKDDREVVASIRSGALGDAFFHVVEQDDRRMEGFTSGTGRTFHTIPLAADKTLMAYARPEARFDADVSFIGTYLPQKRSSFERLVFPLARTHRLRLYGQDWTRLQRLAGLAQKIGQYFHVPLLRSLQKPRLRLEDEARIYASSRISINIHEDYQRSFGGDCNERTFKIPLYGGFEITDDVACVRKYFRPGEEMVIARDGREWFETIDHYLRHPEERQRIIDAGRRRVLAEHTYHHRAAQMTAIASGRVPA